MSKPILNGVYGLTSLQQNYSTSSPSKMRRGDRLVERLHFRLQGRNLRARGG